MRRRGFSLVELIVVMGILICLMTIMLPVLTRVRESGRRVKCLSNLRTLTTAWIAYAGDNDRHLCIGGWRGAVGPYLRTIEPFRCPDDRTNPDVVPYSYSLNGTLAGMLLPGTYQKLDDIRTPATVFVFIEACPPVDPQPPNKAGPAREVFTTPINPQFSLVPWGWPGQNHKGVRAATEGACISFADGHAIFWDYMDSRIGTLEEAVMAGISGDMSMLLGPMDASGYSKSAAPNSPDIYQLEIWSGGPTPPPTVTEWIQAAHP